MSKSTAKKLEYKVGDFVVYPTHGVGSVVGVDKEKIGDVELSLYVIFFEKQKLKVRVPVTRAAVSGLRQLCSKDEFKKAFVTLKSKAKVSRGMWSRRAQEYESKINSGDILLLAEVVRDLHRNVDQPERSYSEKVIYENALGRLIGEYAAIEKLDQDKAAEKVLQVLNKKAA